MSDYEILMSLIASIKCGLDIVTFYDKRKNSK